ncbi:N-6 DNA methylase [Dermatobacter hominis]|uniref:N-6 DNA methylase n=1 Tax=Dermatobacter hominis TaxID=2884263 RepID=UPI001D1209E9|nr:N-6 DNA methylase [Dermatobacter hominis]UDY36788.1 SAM-dependent methyltransferase [Dermatobacter hominis]
MGTATPALDGGASSRSPIERHASSQPATRRRALGSHATPAPLARTLVDVALAHLGRTPRLVVDPACGAGSFLLAAADALVARGVPPDEVVRDRLAGCDVDPQAIAHGRDALCRWAEEHGVRGPATPRLLEHDALLEETPFTGRADLVVGNPPFLAQRTADTARDGDRRAALRDRFGDLGPYVDDAAAFLLVGVEQLAPGGVSLMIQPQSVLSARDATAVRSQLLDRCALVALWADDARHFDADVDVCAPVVRRGPVDTTEVELRWGAEGRPVGSVAVPGAPSWGPLLAAATGVPGAVDPLPAGGRTIGDVAEVTAGFRDEFYALAAAARVAGEPGWDGSSARLVTVGMIDACRLDTATPRRLGGRRVSEPRLDRAALEATAPRVAAWVGARAVPKVLVATQTKVPEAVADPVGDLVPVTPVVTVEPGPSAEVDVWHLAAALSAPTVAAAVAGTHAGSGLSLGAVRLSAASVRALPLPIDGAAWSEGAAIARDLHREPPGPERTRALRRLGAAMVRAHGAGEDLALLDWWCERADRLAGRSADERA